MTYKNIKFEDSPVMRSLEKLAVKKGLVKPEVISKTAISKQLSLKPTENFEENILKLCSALRASGFEKHAAEVENKFFNLKRAQALYGTTGETGEDVINTAHPEGSHQMKDVDGDALVETILDKQKAIQKMVAKVPTGKLGANALANIVKNAGKITKNEAINALKVILAEETTDSLYESANKIYVNFRGLYLSLAGKLGEDNSYNKDYFTILQNILNGKKVYESDNDLESSLSRLVGELKEEKVPGMFASPGEKRVWQEVQPMFDRANQLAVNFNNVLSRIRKNETDSKVNGVKLQTEEQYSDESNPAGKPVNVNPVAVGGSPELGKIFNTISEYTRQLNSWQGFVETYDDPADIKDGMAYINSFKSQLEKFSKALERVDAADAASMAPNFEASLKKLTDQMNEFHSLWINAGK